MTDDGALVFSDLVPSFVFSYVLGFFFLLHKMIYLCEEGLNIVLSSEDGRSSSRPHPLPHLISWPTSVGIRQA